MSRHETPSSLAGRTLSVASLAANRAARRSGSTPDAALQSATSRSVNTRSR